MEIIFADISPLNGSLFSNNSPPENDISSMVISDETPAYAIESNSIENCVLSIATSNEISTMKTSSISSPENEVSPMKTRRCTETVKDVLNSNSAENTFSVAATELVLEPEPPSNSVPVNQISDPMKTPSRIQTVEDVLNSIMMYKSKICNFDCEMAGS